MSDPILNTGQASRVTLLLAFLFGKPQVRRKVIVKAYRGKTYFMDWV